MGIVNTKERALVGFGVHLVFHSIESIDLLRSKTPGVIVLHTIGINNDTEKYT